VESATSGPGDATAVTERVPAREPVIVSSRSQPAQQATSSTTLEGTVTDSVPTLRLTPTLLSITRGTAGDRLQIPTELQSDNGVEFDHVEVQMILQDSGIRQPLIMPYTPQQNGCSERENRTLVEAAKAMRFAHKELPHALWAELINTSAYILNRTGTSSVDGTSPYELWYNKKPKITHLRVIGCTSYVHVPYQRRNKKEDRHES